MVVAIMLDMPRGPPGNSAVSHYGDLPTGQLLDFGRISRDGLERSLGPPQEFPTYWANAALNQRLAHRLRHLGMQIVSLADGTTA